MTFRDELNIEFDHRKLQELVDDGVISAEELANAPVVEVEPTCSCGKGLFENVYGKLVCPQCKKPGIGKEVSNE